MRLPTIAFSLVFALIGTCSLAQDGHFRGSEPKYSRLEMQYQPAFVSTSMNSVWVTDNNASPPDTQKIIAPTNVKRLGFEYATNVVSSNLLDIEALLYLSASKEYFSLVGLEFDASGGTLYNGGFGIAASHNLSDTLAVSAALKIGVESPTSAWFRHQSLYEIGGNVKVSKSFLDDYYASVAVEYWNKPGLDWDIKGHNIGFDAVVQDRNQVGFNFGLGYRF